MKIRSFLITLAFILFGAVCAVSAQDIIVVGGVKYFVHDVVKGETLYSLAKRYGVTVDDIVSVNATLADGLKAGQRIKIPVQSEVAENRAPKFQLHKVVRGETLYSLAKQHNLTVEELRMANPHVKKGLKSGQLIEIPIKEAVAVEKPTLQPTSQPTEPPVPVAQAEVATTASVEPITNRHSLNGCLLSHRSNINIADSFLTYILFLI